MAITMGAVILAILVLALVRNLYTSLSTTISTLACAVAFYLLTRMNFADLSPAMSPDTVSSLFPDRPIRPLPKRRLREKLSPEAADSIKYPPSAHDNVQLFYYPYTGTFKEEGSTSSLDSYSPVSIDQARRVDQTRNYIPRLTLTHHAEVEEEEASFRSALVPRSPPEILNRAGHGSSRPEQARHADPQPPPSTASSVDGYDSFENTSNKKKRKIPSASDSALNGTHALSSDIGSLAISVGTHSPAADVNGDRQSAYPGSGTFATNGQGISGSGRGRLGMSRNGRSPLRALPDGNNSWAPRTPKQGPPQWTQPERERPGYGIISNAIANAEKLPPQGQENVSLLQQHPAVNKTTPASSQFTFTCDSQVPGTVQWPGQPTRNNTMTQTNPTMGGANVVPQTLNPTESPKAASRGSKNSARKGRPRVDKELKMAARERQQIATESYYHNPPTPEDIWICEFCEYERIFGTPPRALIRAYELKDRRHRAEETERKRLLDKAKAKSRKAKKNGKAPVKGNATATQHASSQPHSEALEDQGAPPMHPDLSHSTQSEEDYEYDYGDGYPNSPQSPLPEPGVGGIGIDIGIGFGAGGAGGVGGALNGGVPLSYRAKT